MLQEGETARPQPSEAKPLSQWRVCCGHSIAAVVARPRPTRR
jgi:hypothetical protein